MVDHIFRQYDIRGKVGTELLLEDVYPIARALATYFKQKNPDVETVAVGADGRIHSPAITKELCRGLQESGLNVIFIGVCPTPAMYFALWTFPVQAGLMITASHNGKEYNGIKVCLGKESVWGMQLQDVKNIVHQKKFIISENHGTYQDIEIIETYIACLIEKFPQLLGMKRSIVIDCGNGAAGTVLPQLIKRFDWPNVKLLYPEVDGTYPHHDADPTEEKNMQDLRIELAKTGADFGAGLDGDCDRMTPMTSSGQLVRGDKLLAFFAQDLLQEYPGASVVYDGKCSSGLTELLLAWGAQPIMSATGHSIVKMMMKKHNALLAGELSCHFIFKDHYFGYDDGIYALLRLCTLLEKQQTTLDQLVATFPHRISTPEIRFECAEEQKKEIVDHVIKQLRQRPDTHLATIDGVRADMFDGWGMLRASNTEPVLCMRFEAKNVSDMECIKQVFIENLLPFYTKAFLEKACHTV